MIFNIADQDSKRFVVDEDIDCRVNYVFVSKRRFGSSLNIQELNFVSVVAESCDRLQRHIIMGNATEYGYYIRPSRTQ